MRIQGLLPAAALLLGSLLGAPLLVGAPASVALPYDRTLPVIYDNDGAIESGFTDVYLMALASSRAVQLKGIITTCSYAEEKRRPPFSPVAAEELVRERQELIEKARRSGLANLPDATPGPSLSLKRPASGRIEDTVPFRTPGGRLIVKEARRATPDRPLVIVMGGQGTCVVDAYLMDPSIADRMVLAWIVGNKRATGEIDCREYNLGIDPWAAYIAFERLRVVAFPFSNNGNDADDGFAATPKSRLGELPETELRQTMREAAWPRGKGTFSEPNVDYDAMPALPLTRPDYALKTKRVSFVRWDPHPWTAGWQAPFFRESPEGRTLVVWESDAKAATDEWWRRVKDPAAWGPAAGQIPFTGRPWDLPGSVQAEHFDHGGEGRAYHDKTINLTKEEWINPIRFLEQVDLLASGTAGGGYKVGRAEAGEWMAYTVALVRAGAYTVEVRVASAGPGGTFHVEFDGVDRTGPMAIPDTGGKDSWRSVSRANVALKAGRQVMRLVMDANGPDGAVGEFDQIGVVRGPQAGGNAGRR